MAAATRSRWRDRGPSSAIRSPRATTWPAPAAALERPTSSTTSTSSGARASSRSSTARRAPHVLVALRHCGDRASELACGKSIDEVVAPGTYFVAVDGESADALGRFNLVYSLQDLSAQAAACASAPVLISGKTVSSSTAGVGGPLLRRRAVAPATPAGTGADRVFRFTLAARSAVRLNLLAQGFDATLAVRHVCGDAPAGLAGAGLRGRPRRRAASAMDLTLDPGTYYVVVDGQGPGDEGPFTLEYRAVTAR